MLLKMSQFHQTIGVYFTCYQNRRCTSVEESQNQRYRYIKLPKLELEVIPAAIGNFNVTAVRCQSKQVKTSNFEAMILMFLHAIRCFVLYNEDRMSLVVYSESVLRIKIFIWGYYIRYFYKLWILMLIVAICFSTYDVFYFLSSGRTVLSAHIRLSKSCARWFAYLNLRSNA